MPFSRSEILRVTEIQLGCAICGIRFGSNCPPEVHSKTTLHLVNGVATSPPPRYPELKKKYLGWNIKGGDAVALCRECHDELHRMYDQDEMTVQQILELSEFIIENGW
jgi:hypothetical protein